MSARIIVKTVLITCRYGDDRAITAFGVVCTGEERTVSQCRTRGGFCVAGSPEFNVAIECGGQIDGCE